MDGLRLVETKYHQPKKDAIKESWIAPACFRCRICDYVVYYGDRNLEDVDYLHTFKANGNRIKKDKRETDHLKPIIPIDGYPSGLEIDFNYIINETLYRPKEGYQVICSICHDKKSAEENEKRREYKKIKKICQK